MVKLWQSLEAIPVAAAVAAEWQSWTGELFPAFKTAFLQACGEPAASFPCPRECGCQHRVVPHASGQIVAVCECDPWNCDNIALTRDDVVMWQINRSKFGRAVAKAFDCDAKDTDLRIAGTRQVASFGDAALPVVLTIQHDRASFASAVAQLVATLKERFILLAPTNRFLDGHSQTLLKGAKAGFFDLASTLVLLPDGKLHAAKKGGVLFSPYLPTASEPTDENQARQVFALIEKLESGRRQKPPSVMEVFRLYCIKGKTTEQIKDACRCSKGTVVNRLDAIRRATRTEPDDLRAFSPYLQRIEETITDSRAEHIHRKALVHDNKETDDETD
jgi:hypothetical protein